jgi:hypothetical protein
MRSVVSAIFVASALAVGLSAQGQPPATQSQPPADRPEQAAPREPQPAAPREAQPAAPREPQAATAQLTKVTIGGCIQNAPAAAPAAGAAPSSPAASKFELANAKMVTSGPVGTTGAAAPVTRYRLDGDEKTITTHLNHQVEITGTVGPALGTAAPMLKVDSVKMVAATCPAASR